MKPAHLPDKATPQTWRAWGVETAGKTEQYKQDDTPLAWRWQQGAKPSLVAYVGEHRRSRPSEPLPAQIQRDLAQDWRMAGAQ